MNFQQVLQAKGQKDDQGYDLKVTILGRFGANMEFGKTQKGADKCSVKVTDKDNVTHKVHLYGTLPTAAMCTQRAEFNIAAFDGQGQQGAYVGYSGIWNSRATVLQDGQGQQPAPQANQPANAAPVSKPVYTDPTQTSIERQVCVKAVGRMAAERADMELREAAGWLGFFSHWIKTGQFVFTQERPTQPSGPNPNYVGDSPPPPKDDDIPF